MLSLPQVDLGDGFEVDVPQADAAVSSSRGEPFLAGVHAEDPCLNETKTFPSTLQQTNMWAAPRSPWTVKPT